MDIEIRNRFSSLWQNYFEGAELPITAELGDDNGTATKASIPNGQKCLIGDLSILYYSWFEQQKESPKAVLGMFDPSTRPLVDVDTLTMAIPMKKRIAQSNAIPSS